VGVLWAEIVSKYMQLQTTVLEVLWNNS
jgi:hypothetical protein